MPAAQPSNPETDAIPDGFEPSLEALSRAVAELESGDLDLDEALAAHDRGTRLLARCRSLLDAADARVARLIVEVDESGEPETVPLDAAPTPEPRPGSSPRPKPKAKSARKPKPAADPTPEPPTADEPKDLPTPNPSPRSTSTIPAPPWLDAGDFPGFDGDRPGH